MLDEQTEIIDLLKKRIRDDGHALRANETRTRAVLIDPVLQMLDWDVSDPKAVTLEYEVGKAKADYALLGSNGRPVAVIEAKKLDEPLQSHLTQMLTYAVMAGIRFAGLTNGDTWQIYSVFEESALSEKLKLNVSIANDPSHECVLKLLWLWRPNLSSGKPVSVEKPEPPKPKPVSPKPQGGWVSLLDFAATPGAKPPQYIKFPNQPQRDVSYWYELLTHTAEWLCAGGLLTENRMPLRRGASRKRCIINTEPRHPSGIDFKKPKAVAGTSFVVEANVSGARAVSDSKRLLELCGQSLDTVQISISSQLPEER